jgi:YfiH family protein
MSFERRDLGEGASALVASELGSIGVLAAFTERTGGMSTVPFDSLNVSLSVGDEPAAVRANRRHVTEGLGIRPFAVAGLVHGSKLARVGPERAGAGFTDPAEVVAGADGLLTSTAGISLAVTSADCVPLVFACPTESTIAVIHAGWRGFAAGVLDRAAEAFQHPREVRVAVGPAIGPCHYEVDGDVASAVAAASSAGAVTARRGDRLALDLVATARKTLRAWGIRNIEDTGLCTACERERFFSHRRDGAGGGTGRQAAIAVRFPARSSA